MKLVHVMVIDRLTSEIRSSNQFSLSRSLLEYVSRANVDHLSLVLRIAEQCRHCL